MQEQYRVALSHIPIPRSEMRCVHHLNSVSAHTTASCPTYFYRYLRRRDRCPCLTRAHSEQLPESLRACLRTGRILLARPA